MKKGKGDGNLEKLRDQGFGKSKAMQALKDAGGNYQLALSILRQRKELTTEKQTLIVAKPQSTTSRAEVEIVNEKLALKERKHPCIVQYKKCIYGDSCRLKDLPGDTCINYCNWSCIHGDMCFRRHTIDGVSVRNYLSPVKHDVSDIDNPKYDSAPGSDINTVELPRHKLDFMKKDFHWISVSAIKDSDSSYCNHIPKSQLLYVDPVSMTDQNGVDGASEASSRPQPYLSKVRQLAHSPGPYFSQTQDERNLNSIEVMCPPPSYTNKTMKHPCIKQFGKCWYGKNCWYVDYDSDICIHFLMGQCKYTGETCRYRHETDKSTSEVHQADSAKTRLPHPIIPKVFMPFTNQVDQSNPKPNYSLSVVEEPFTPFYQTPVHPPDPARITEAFFSEPVDETNDDDISDEPWGHDFFNNDSNDPTQDSSMGATTEEEMNSLLSLMEVFPDTEPSVLLCLLRLNKGDPNAAVGILERIESMAVEDMDNAFAQAFAEEEEEESIKRNNQCESTDNLLTLHALFPTIELRTIEVVLDRFENNLLEAYDLLLCSQEKITQSEYGNVWSGEMTCAEQMRFKKICGMFPEIEPSIVHNIFGISNKNSNDTVNCLNQLTSELLDPVEREAMGREATSWRPQFNPEGKPCAAAPPDRFCPTQKALHDTPEATPPIPDEFNGKFLTCGDWRRIRKSSYAINTCRIRVLSQASAAFLRGDGKTAKVLSRKGRDLGAEYQRLNRLAMLSLEQERLANDSIMTLDLHGFHVEEALEVLSRRVQLCVKKRIPRLTIIIGEGKHNRKGYSIVYRAVLDNLKTDSFLSAKTRITSVKSALVEVRIKFNPNFT
ncbi:unnamed protein product [Phytomonas sp. Hart1]|nr:unnamed protein product [Phytomonas sp. Hart1]|eukprot:CCW71289.1 unnamed protein product [Phytomonas sp. isolate Hart1]